MNKRILVIIFIILIICLSITFFISIKNYKPNVKFLGSPINSFYKEKTVKIQNPPKRIDEIQDPNVLAESAILIYEPNKYILYSKNPNNSIPIASITKVMTAMVALDLYRSDDIITVDEKAIDINGSKIFLKKDEKIRFDDLLYGMLMNSGNDAASALSMNKTSQEEFINLMNLKAEELGLKNTKFNDVAGLDDNGRSSAYDVAILFSNAFKNELFKKIISTPEKQIFSVDKKTVHDLKNSNRLVNGEMSLGGVVGGKTGFTPEAGHTLVCSAERNNSLLVAVVLKTFSDDKSASAEEARKLLEWGFSNFTFNQT